MVISTIKNNGVQSTTHVFVRAGLVFALVSFVLASFVFDTQKTKAAPNYEINYQGKLTNASNVAVADGTYNMRFWLTDSPSVATTSALWTEELTGANKVQVTNGLFSIMLGSTTALTGVDFNQTLYLGVEIGGTSTPAWDGEMSPRKILGTVPSAFEAENARTLDNLATTSLLRSDVDDTASGLLTFTGGLISNSSTTITNLTTDIATTTTLVINGERFTDLTGGSLTMNNGALTVATSTFFTNSSQFAQWLDDETGTGSVVFSESPSFSGLATLADLIADNATSTNLAITGKLYDAGGTAGTNGYVLQTTGTGVQWVSTTTLGISGGVADGMSNWLIQNGALTPSTTLGIRINASSTIGDGTGTGGLTILGNSTTTGVSHVQTGLSVGGAYLTNVNVQLQAHTLSGSEATPFLIRNSGTSAGSGVRMLFMQGSLDGARIGTSIIDSNTTDFIMSTRGNGTLSEKMRLTGLGNLGLGTTSPSSKLTIEQGIGGSWNLFQIASSSNGTATTTHFVVDRFGNVGVGTTSPSSLLAVQGTVTGANFTAYSTTSTTTLAGGLNVGEGGLVYDLGTGETYINSLISGTQTFDYDAGTVQWTDLPVWSSGLDTVQSYTASIGGNEMLTIYGLSSGASTTYSNRVGIGSSTPSRFFTVAGDGYFTNNITSASSTLGYASTTALTVSGNTVLAHATATSLYATTLGIGTDYITDITGTGLSVTNGVLNVSGGNASNWLTQNGALTPSTTLGIRINASSTIGDGTGAGGLTILGNSTTTGNAYFVGNVGVGSSSPSARLSIRGTAGSATPLLTVASSTGSTSLSVLASGDVEMPNTIINAGIKWTTRTAASTTGTYNGIAYGNGVFVAVGDKISMVSSDGINWATTTPAASNNWYAVTYGNGLFVAVSSNGTGNSVMTSPDGITWTGRASAEDNAWYGLTYGNGLFVAVALSGAGNRVMTSPDGINWTARSAVGNDDFWTSVTYGNGLFVATAWISTGGNVMTSPDGINWTHRSATGDNDSLWGITYGNGRFVAVGASSDYVITSLDGINWTATTISSGDYRRVAYGNGLFVITSSNATNVVMTSPDGVNWVSRTIPESNSWYGLTYGNGLFVAVAQNGTNRVMTSGKTLTSALAHNNIYQGGMSVLGGAFNIGTTTPTTSPLYGLNVLNIASTSGSSLLTISNSGNVGIGSSTPSRTLSVTGDASFSGLATFADLLATNATTTNLAVTGKFYDAGGTAGQNGYILQTTGTGVQWVATSTLGLGGADGMSNWLTQNGALTPSSTIGIRINASSTIGDGTGAGGLTIYGNSTTTGGIKALTSGGIPGLVIGDGFSYAGSNPVFGNIVSQGGAAFGDGNTATGINSFAGGTQAYATGDNSFAFGGSGASDVRANGFGSVALGQYAHAEASTAFVFGSYVIATSTASDSFLIGKGFGYGDELVNDIPSSLMIGFDSDIPTFFVGPSSGVGTIGNVGIGTTSPRSTLTIQGSGTTNPFTIASSSGSSMLTVNANGNVTVGAVTSPNPTLTVAGSSGYTNINGYSIVGSNGLYLYNGLANTNSAFLLQDDRAVVRSNSGATGIVSLEGSVGIGTSTPSRLLTVQGGDFWLGGNMTATGTLTVSGNTALTHATTTSLYATTLGIGTDYITDITGTGLSITNGVLSASGDGLSNWLTQNGALTPSTTLGIRINASSTIGDGTGAGGLTIYGNSTTTGNASVTGALSAASMTVTSGNSYYLGGRVVLTNTGTTMSVGTDSTWTGLGFGPGLTAKMFINSSGNVGIGTTTPASTFTIQGSGTTNPFAVASSTGSNLFSINSSGILNIRSGTSTQASTTNIFVNGGSATTTVLRNIALGFDSLTNITTGADDNIAFGYQALYGSSTSKMTGTNNFAAGYQAGAKNIGGSYNTFIGSLAGNENSSGSGNTFIGNSSGSGNTTGSNNTFIGNVAGSGNTTGSSNFFSGVMAGWANNEGSNNIFIGENAGQNNGASNNIALGYQALLANTSGTDNIANGYQALFSNDTGSNNIAHGRYALTANTTGSSNIANGYQSLNGNSLGSNNIASGDWSLFSNTVGSSNIALGSESLNLNTTGSSNIAFGASAGWNLGSSATSSNNIFIGGSAGYNQTQGDNNIFIGYDSRVASTTGSNQLSIGNLIYGLNTASGANVATGTVGIGTTSPRSTLTIQGSGTTNPFTIASSSGSSMLTVLANGNVGVGSSTPVAKLSVTGTGGSGNIFALASSTGSNLLALGADGRIKFGNDANADILLNGGKTTENPQSNQNNVAIGNQAFTHYTSGSATHNTAIGYQALMGSSTVPMTGDYNLAVGYTSLSSNTTGSNNNAFGNATLFANTTGSGNNAFGNASLSSNTVGTYNNALGFATLAFNESGSHNNAFGFVSLYNNTTGSYNNAIGFGSIYTNTTGSHNNALGYNAGNLLGGAATSSNNTFLGAYAGQSQTLGDNNIFLGYDTSVASTTGSNQLSIGNLIYGLNTASGANIATGTVGIGTTSPRATLTIQGSGTTNLFAIASSSGSSMLTVLANGNVGIGSSTPSRTLSVTGDASFSGLATLSSLLATNATTTSLYTGMLGLGSDYITDITGTGLSVTNGVLSVSGGNASNWLTQNGALTPSTTLGIRINASSTIGDGTGAGGLTILGNSTTTGNAYFGGNVGVGTTTMSSLLTLDKSALTGSLVGGIKEYLNFVNSTASAVYYGNEAYFVNAPTATSTFVGNMIRIEDTSTLGNTVRGLEAQAFRGTNTKGENTGLSGFGRTFGVRGTTLGDAGSVYVPAGVFAESQGTTQGNALRAYSGTLTSEDLVSLFHDGSAFSGTGLSMNFGNSGGSFAATSSAKFIDLQVGGTSKFTITAAGTTTIGDGTTANMAGLQIGFGGLCVDNDGSCTASTTGRITSVSSASGNSDLAEMYFSSEALESGEIVSLEGGLSIGRADEMSTGAVIGVVSTKPGLIMGFDDTSLVAGEVAYPVALKGRVPIKLSTENGPIRKGDRITLSSIPGIGMKANDGDMVVGIALEDYSGEYAYSETYLNQFGDDLVKAKMQVRSQDTDPRTQDGCSYGGGNAQGEAPCVKEKVSPIKPEVVSIDTRTEVLRVLKTEEATVARTPAGQDVTIGQAIMFVHLHDFIAQGSRDILAELSTTTSLSNGNGIETLWDRVKALAQNFVDGVLRVAGIKTDELCVGNVCVDEATFLRMVENAGGSQTSGGSSDVVEDSVEVIEDSGGGTGGLGEEALPVVEEQDPLPEEPIPIVEAPSEGPVVEAPPEESAPPEPEPAPEVPIV